MFYSNCLFVALSLYFKEGGYLTIRKSKLGGIFPHVIWIKDLKDAEIIHFVPSDPTPKKIYFPYFKGYLKYED